MYFLLRVNVVNGIVNSCWSFTQSCSDQINLTFIVAAVPNGVDTLLADSLLAIDDNLVTVEVQTPIFKIANR